ncbi:MAG: hypothetical protein ABI466_02415 [Chloroflexota bacterium]
MTLDPPFVAGLAVLVLLTISLGADMAPSRRSRVLIALGARLALERR